MSMSLSTLNKMLRSRDIVATELPLLLGDDINFSDFIEVVADIHGSKPGRELQSVVERYPLAISWFLLNKSHEFSEYLGNNPQTLYTIGTLLSRLSISSQFLKDRCKAVIADAISDQYKGVLSRFGAPSDEHLIIVSGGYDTVASTREFPSITNKSNVGVTLSEFAENVRYLAHSHISIYSNVADFTPSPRSEHDYVVHDSGEKTVKVDPKSDALLLGRLRKFVPDNILKRIHKISLCVQRPMLILNNEEAKVYFIISGHQSHRAEMSWIPYTKAAMKNSFLSKYKRAVMKAVVRHMSSIILAQFPNAYGGHTGRYKERVNKELGQYTHKVCVPSLKFDKI